MIGFNETQHNHLLGKVVLLVANDAEALQTMTLSLAEKGADIAALCTEVPDQTLDLLQESVETMGQRFLLLSQEDQQGPGARNTVQQVTASLGHLDVFIDLTSSRPTTVVGRDNSRQTSRLPERDWRMIFAALSEMVPTPQDSKSARISV